ncbi:DNA-3-methyladenine glycosylase family protein [Kytococcus sedentarius]|uniref:DNA-3-methyladenine glycosylase family protein n=1 Tax=Kytococcus sedentarius TaxID=1276 RepID=UPI00194ECD66|nr:DNA-3-methyladenine glycosylase 2 family protein [Kytococcus sedentarius]QRO87926.1 DNA-3-methyladenine glycosylase 2 family protein [Kytococcus sedentarius]
MTSSYPSPPHEGTRVWQADWPVDLPRTLGSLRRGAGDLTTLLPAAGQFVLAANTPAGPGTLHLGVGSSPRQVHARAWGGAAAVDWLLDGVPELLGARDRPQDFQPVHEPLVRAHAHWSPRLRVMRTRRVWDALLPAVIEQKVTGQEAFAGYRALVAAAGSPAPGPAGDRGLRVPPGPREVLRVPSWVWITAGIDAARSDAVLRAARSGAALERLASSTAGMDRPSMDRAHRAVRTVPGLGVWTAAEVAQRALGDADAVSWRDYHVAGHITRVLTGAAGGDVELARVLAPYAGHRFRVQLLLRHGAAGPERRGPRMAPRTHLPVARGRHTPSSGEGRA